MVVLQVVAFAIGLVVVVGVSLSAIRTVILPRGQAVWLSHLLFVNTRKVFDLRARLAKTYEDRDRIMALYAPLTLVLLPGVWLLLVIAAFTLMFWALGSPSWPAAIEASVSSITTLGISPPPTFATTLLAASEALIGLGLVALLISYLPAIYASYQRRELLVCLLEVRAGDPPSALVLLRRHHQIGSFDRMFPLFSLWETWFADIEETHTSQGSLSFFRSPLAGRSWVTAAGAVLDAAALTMSTVEVEPSPEAALCLRAGFLALRRIAGFFGIPYDADPAPDAPISVDRSEFDAVCDEMAGAGITLRTDRDRAWRDFSGWRVNYDQVLIALAGLTMAPLAPWSSDRSVRVRVSQRPSVNRP